jgi:hypothetical protein
MTRPLASGYSTAIDSSHGIVWTTAIASFRDANLYQLAGQSGARSTSRFVLHDNSAIVSMAEVRIKRLPLIGLGMAYVFRGPLVDGPHVSDHNVFRQSLRALRNEYVGKRGLVLRINSNLVEEFDGERIEIFKEEGFAPVPYLRRRQSLLVDLSAKNADDVRENLDKKWRNCLRKAEKSELDVVSGQSLEYFDAFLPLYDAMLQRKRFRPTADVMWHRRIQQDLPDPLKMTVVLATLRGQPCAGAIVSRVGERAVFLFGAANDEGLRTCASYLVQWRIVTDLMDAGCRYYDLNGINRVTNEGTFHFKRGLAGRTGIEVTDARQFQAQDSDWTRSAIAFVEKRWRQRRAQFSSSSVSSGVGS